MPDILLGVRDIAFNKTQFSPHGACILLGDADNKEANKYVIFRYAGSGKCLKEGDRDHGGEVDAVLGTLGCAEEQIFEQRPELSQGVSHLYLSGEGSRQWNVKGKGIEAMLFSMCKA